MKPSINKIKKHITEIETIRMQRQQPKQYFAGQINAICTIRKEIEQIEKTA